MTSTIQMPSQGGKEQKFQFWAVHSSPFAISPENLKQQKEQNNSKGITEEWKRFLQSQNYK